MGEQMDLDCAKIISKKLPEASEGEGPRCLRRRVSRTLRLNQKNGLHANPGPGQQAGQRLADFIHWQCISRMENNHLEGLPIISEK